MLDAFLSPADANRATDASRKLARHNITGWAFTGGFAIEFHRMRLGLQPSTRVLNDIDFVAATFDSIPQTLADDFLFRHIHPLDPPGKTILQSVDPANALRIDVFRTHSSVMSRTSVLELPFGRFRLISLEDLASNLMRLVLDLVESVPLPPKHAADFLRLVDCVSPDKAEAAWQDYRKPKHPSTFEESRRVLRDLIPVRRDLLIAPSYSRDTQAACARCSPAGSLGLAEPSRVLELLGYC